MNNIQQISIVNYFNYNIQISTDRHYITETLLAVGYGAKHCGLWC
jgi:hypothetical protein